MTMLSEAYDPSENYRDVMMSMQDLYMSNVNLRLNEVMKVMTIVTCLLAPATCDRWHIWNEFRCYSFCSS